MIVSTTSRGISLTVFSRVFAALYAGRTTATFLPFSMVNPLDAIASEGFATPSKPALKLLLPVYKDKHSLQSPLELQSVAHSAIRAIAQRRSPSADRDE